MARGKKMKYSFLTGKPLKRWYGSRSKAYLRKERRVKRRAKKKGFIESLFNF